ncbi:MAG TPA: ATP-binding protein [Puia sp.]|nr:ATP-binding protein [Puia sp.]
MIPCRAVLLLLLSTGLCITLPAQRNYLVQHFTTENGLPSNGIKGLEWDEGTGFLWIATEAGVTRYNGMDFLTFSKANTPGIFSERMYFMLKNRLGRIYTSDEVGNIFFIMQNKLQYLDRVRLDIRPSTFKLIGLAASGRLFRHSSDQSPDRFGFNFKDEILIPLSDDRILLYHTDSSSEYVPGLYDYTAGKKEPVLVSRLEPGARIFRLDGKIFVFRRDQRLYELDTAGKRQIPVRLGFGWNAGPGTPREGDGQLFWESGMRYPILVARSQAWALEYVNKRLDARLIAENIPTDMLLSYAQYDEKSGILFLGTNSRGILTIRKNQVRQVKIMPASIDQTSACYSQLALPNGSVLASRLTDQTGIVGGPALPRSAIPVKTTSFNNFILLSPDSVLWYSHSDSVYSYSYRTGKTGTYAAGSGSITDGFALSGGRLYIANAIGIGHLENGRISYLYRHPQPDINSNVPFSMLELSPGILVMASCNGLLRWDTRINKLDTVLHLPGTCIRALWKYKDYLFIGTYGKGIYIWKNGVIRSIPTDKNNYLQYAHCFIQDKQGFCWISTNKGLFRTRPEDMVDAFEKNLPQIYYHYYGKNDGMEITELNGGCTPCALALNDSTISFPSMDGLVWVNPAGTVTLLPEGNIYIDELYADGKKVNAGSLVMPELQPNTRELVFRLGFPAWAEKENLYIEYKLEPYSREWQSLEVQNNPALRFSNLPSGDYHLIVRKLSGFGEGNYKVLESRFRITAHWYQQLWAWLLTLFCLTTLIMWIVRQRTRQFKERQHRLERQIEAKTKELKLKNEELEKTDHIKTRLISIISHDLVTPLKFLHLAGKSLLEKKSQLSEELQRETVAEIMNTSKELELLSTNILNWIKYRNEDRRLAKESFNLHQLTAQLFGIFNSMAKQKQIRLINEVDANLELYQFIEPVKIVLYNLVLNGINFTSEGHIRVSSSADREGVILVIEDTGVGMTPEQINNIMADHFIISSANVDKRKGNGLGYLIIKDLLKIIRGSLSIRSEKGKGARVTIRLPV